MGGGRGSFGSSAAVLSQVPSRSQPPRESEAAQLGLLAASHRAIPWSAGFRWRPPTLAATEVPTAYWRRARGFRLLIKYTLLCYDNFHFMDDGERDVIGEHIRFHSALRRGAHGFFEYVSERSNIFGKLISSAIKFSARIFVFSAVSKRANSALIDSPTETGNRVSKL
jgi:hypothetical protein